MNCWKWCQHHRNNWTPDWPTEEGHYWFYGRSYDRASVLLYQVKVFNSCQGWIFESGFSYLYKDEAKGVWQKAFVPKLPESI